MNSTKFSRVTKVFTQALVAITGSATIACSSSTIPPATPTPNPSSSPTADTFVLSNNTPSTPEAFTLPSTGTIVTFYGTITISGATSETVQYYETKGFGSGACPITGKTVIETIAFTFPTSFAFSPNGSYGLSSGLLDTQFTTSTTGSFNGALYQYSTCTVFSPAQTVFSNTSTSYEYPGGGNTNVPAGTYFLEIWK